MTNYMCSKIRSKIRINNWWTSFISMIFGFIFFTLFLSEKKLSVELSLQIVLFLSATIAFSALGYLTNDLFDRKEDNLSGKTNILRSNNTTILLFVFSIILTILPWFFLYFKPLVYILLGTQLFLFLIYLSPPSRLKNEKIGFAIDATYAYVNPFLIVFAYFGEGRLLKSNYFLFVLLISLFLIGIRNIMSHQVEDFESDIKLKSRNLVQSIGVKRSLYVIKVLFILESILFFIFSVWFFLEINNFIFTYTYLIFIIVFWCGKINKDFINGNFYYHAIFPICAILLYAENYKQTICLLTIYLFLFWRSEYSSLYSKTCIFISKIINVIIYRFFLLFKVNLIEEKFSAYEYVCKRIRDFTKKNS